MIHVYHASADLLAQFSTVENERQLVTLVVSCLNDYQLATRVKHAELDIAFAATGGKSNWVNVDNMSVGFEPEPERATVYGDVLVEAAHGYANLSTPAGFIPLVDVVESFGTLTTKRLN